MTGRRSSSELAAVAFGRRMVWSKKKSREAPVLVLVQVFGNLHASHQVLHLPIINVLDVLLAVKILLCELGYMGA